MLKSLFFNELAKILSSDKFFMTEKGKQELLAELFIQQKQSGFLEIELPTYLDTSKNAAKKLSEESNIPLTCDYEDLDINNPAVAYYVIRGTIMGESNWRFSTKQFNADLKAAEENPMIMSHFIQVNSGGGDAWFLDVAWKTMMGLKKPIVVEIERVCASAALYLICPASKIYAATQNEIIGSIGTMVSFLDFIPYFEAQGVKNIEEYAKKSDLKNKKFNDLLKGKPKQFITEELDPLQQQFETSVRTSRKKAGALEENHPLFRGETYDTQAAIDLGLIDGQKDLPEAIQEAYDLGKKYMDKNKSALHYLNTIN